VDKKQFLEKLEAMLEIPKDTLNPRVELRTLGVWDSLAVLSFIALVDESLGIALNGSNVSKAKTVQDLIDLVKDKLIE